MICKYCHAKTHLIDKCPTIICKVCKEIGHPQWLCKLKKTSKNNGIEKKYSFSDEIKKKPNNETIIQKNIDYYLKIEDKLWGNIAEESFSRTSLLIPANSPTNKY